MTATTSAAHVDPAAPSATTAAARQQQQQQQQVSESPSLPSSADLLGSLTAAVHESLAGYLYHDAIELAQRLFNLSPTFPHLHLLAHCYVLSGAVGTAHRLLHHHFPFFEVHVTRPRTAAGPAAAHGAVDSATLPLDGRRTWTASAAAVTATTAGAMEYEASSPFSSPRSTLPGRDVPDVAGSVDLSYETVDLKAQWDCQYLLGVCCYRTQRYGDGLKVLSQLLYVKHQLDAASTALRKQAAQQSADRVAVARQLRSYSFATDARVSQVCYWLGLCEKHRQRPPIAADYLRRSFAAHPTRLDAFQEYVRLAWPTEATVQEMLTVKEPLAEEEEDGAGVFDGDEDNQNEEQSSFCQQQQQQQQRPPQRRGRDGQAEEACDEEQAGGSRRAMQPQQQHQQQEHSRLRRAAAQLRCRSAQTWTLDGPVLTAAQRRCTQQHLLPVLRAAFLSLTYRCPEAVEALSSLLSLQQQAAAALPSAGPARVRPLSGASPATSPLLLRHLALAQFHNGDVQESADTFDSLLRAAPWDLTNTALIFFSTALWHLKRESALGSLAQRLTDAEPFSPTTFCVVANAYSLIKDPRDALVMLKRAVQLAPTLAYAHALYGYELLGQDSKAEAEGAFKTALAADHTLYIAYAGLGERFIRDEQVDRARGYYKEAIKLNPTPAIMNRFALTYHRQNNSATHLKCALRLYSESLLRHPNNLMARRQRTDVLLRLDRAAEALEELKALLTLCPGEAAIYLTLAECMVCLRRPQEALQHYQTAMHLDPRRESYVQGCIDRLVAANML